MVHLRIVFWLSALLAAPAACSTHTKPSLEAKALFPHPENTKVQASDFVTPRVGWVALVNSVEYAPQSPCERHLKPECVRGAIVLLKTADAGAHWTRQDLPLPRSHGAAPGIPHVMLEFLNRNDGYAAISFGQEASPLLLATGDGGAHWQNRQLPHDMWPTNFTTHFIDSRHGWILGNTSLATGNEWMSIFRTTDGARYWSSVAVVAPGTVSQSGLVAYGEKNDLTFRDALSGWLAGEDNSGGVELYRSMDGGRLWRLQRLPSIDLLAAQTGSRVSLPVQFLTPRIAALPVEIFIPRHLDGGAWRLFAYFSTDGGASWHKPRQLMTLWAVSGPTAVQFLDVRNWYVAGAHSLWTSSDRGKSWRKTALPLDTKQGTVAMRFLDWKHGWVMAATIDGNEVWSRFQLLRTTDGGSTWQKVRLPT